MRETGGSGPWTHPAWRTLAWVLAIAPVLLLACSPSRFVYDEVFYLGIALKKLRASGDVLDYLKNHWGMVPGPLHAAIHWAASHWSEASPHGARLVNGLMFYGMVCALLSLLRSEGLDRRAGTLTALLALAVPPAWIIAGMALTEMPALFCITVAFWLVCQQSAGASDQRLLPGILILAGLFAGLSVIGRQPYLLIIPLLAALLVWRRRSWMHAAVFASSSAIIPGALFLVWGGLTSPMTQYANSGLRWEHGLLGMAYTGIFFTLLSPHWLLTVPWRLTAAAAAIATVLNLAFVGFQRPFMSTLAERYLPISAEMWGRLGGTACVAVAAVSVVAFVHHCWQRRTDALYIVSNASVLAMVGIAAAISHLFSSRYPAMALPFLVVASMRHRKWDAVDLTAAVAGAVLGAVSLLSYYYLTPLRLSDFEPGG